MSVQRFRELDSSGITTLLCDADGTLFPSEEPAYAASAGVTNKFLAGLGAPRSYEAAELQGMTNGKNFRAAAADLAAVYGRTLERNELDGWVSEEKDVVTAHLRTVLAPDPSVISVVEQLAAHYRLAAVTSSASSRLDACLEVTGLSFLFPPADRFSAEDSLPQPTSKPDPAVYTFAGQQLGIGPTEAVAIEDSVNGALSAAAAGFPAVGIVQFVPEEARAERVRDLAAAGVVAVVRDWSELESLLRAD